MKKTLTEEQIKTWWNTNMPDTLTSDELDMIEMYEKDNDLYINVTLDDLTLEQFKSELEEWLGTEVEQIKE